MELFTTKQIQLLTQCKNAGYGWAKFAKSVEESGNCSPKQEQTLIKMLCRISTANINKSQRSQYSHPGYDNISDNEAMRSGDFF